MPGPIVIPGADDPMLRAAEEADRRAAANRVAFQGHIVGLVNATAKDLFVRFVDQAYLGPDHGENPTVEQIRRMADDAFKYATILPNAIGVGIDTTR